MPCCVIVVETRNFASLRQSHTARNLFDVIDVMQTAVHGHIQQGGRPPGWDAFPTATIDLR